MSTFSRVALSRSARRSYLVSLAGAAAVFVACNEQKIITGFEGDIVTPVIAILKTNGDTMDVSQGLKFSVNAADNLGLKTISIALSGGFTAQIDTTFRTAVTSTSLPITITFPKNTSAGGPVRIRATATDGNQNSATAQDSLFLTNIDALIVNLLAPLPNAVTSGGKQVLIQVQATQKQGVKKIGWVSAGAAVGADSLVFGPPGLQDTLFFEDTLTVPAGLTSGTFTVNGFAEDSGGRRVATPPVTVTIQSIASDATPPVVTFVVANRVEVRDSVSVRATDPSGIIKIGWQAVDRNTGVVVGGDSLFGMSGAVTDVSQKFNLNFGFTLFPQQVIIQAFAEDANGNRGEATVTNAAGSPIKRDTITVVNGITKPLPAGGRVLDAIYNRNLNEIYMTNVDLDRLEVYSVTDTSFVASVPTGSQPYGVALWPRDTLGANADTVVVANSGGTNLSIVDVLNRRERRRHALPNVIVDDVELQRDPQTNAVIGVKLTSHDFSDRPQYLGMVCRPAGGTACASDSIYAVYSTKPTLGQAFPNRGSMRWENLTAAVPQSHLFWEQARPSSGPDTLFEFPDTIQITVDGGGRPSPVIQMGASCLVSVILDNLVFRDTTYVRNSGNFTHVMVGEGGGSPTNFARVLAFDAAAGLTSVPCPAFLGMPASFRERENGVSPGRHVSDFISNTSISVKSIATNFTGRTNMVRADQIYVLNNQLRLTGIMQTGGANVGMDLNFDHRFDAENGGTPAYGGTLSPNDRLAFAARPDATIDVFDTYWYGPVTTISVRDPITGPIRVAKLPSGEQILVGVTARGVVTARLPAIVNLPNYLTPGWGPGATR